MILMLSTLSRERGIYSRRKISAGKCALDSDVTATGVTDNETVTECTLASSAKH